MVKNNSTGYLFYGSSFSECYKYEPSSLFNISWEKYSYYHYFMVSETMDLLQRTKQLWLALIIYYLIPSQG